MKNRGKHWRPVLCRGAPILERSAWRRPARSTVSKSVPVHAHTMMAAFQLVHFGLLVGRECLVKRSLRLGMCHRHLRGKGSNRVRSLLNPGGIVLLDCRFEIVMGRAHLIVRGFGIVGDLAED